MNPGNSRSDYSLQTRLLIAVSILLFIFLGLTGIVLDRAFRSGVETSVAEQLQAQIYVLLAAVDKEGEEFYFVQDLREPRFTQLNSGLYGLVSSPVGGERLRTPSALEMEFDDFASLWQELDRGELFFGRVTVAEGSEYFVAAYNVVWENSEDEFNFAVVESTSTYLAEVNKFRTSLWSWLGGVALVLLVLQLLLLHWGLTLLRRLAGDLKRMESGSSEELTESYPRELRAVTDNLNMLIKAERKQQQRYRETLGDLAHSLKTPLAVMTGIMETLTSADKDDAVDAREQIRNAQEQLERMNQIIGYQLQRAVKTTGTSTLARRVGVADAADRIIRALDKVYAGKAMRTHLSIDPAILFMGDERDLMEVLGNVIDNAYKYGKSELKVTASVSQEARRSPRSVSEDGRPGLS